MPLPKSFHITFTPSFNGPSMTCNTPISSTNSTKSHSIYLSIPVTIAYTILDSTFQFLQLPPSPPSLEVLNLVPKTFEISSIDTCLLFNISDPHKSLTVLLSLL